MTRPGTVSVTLWTAPGQPPVQQIPQRPEYSTQLAFLRSNNSLHYSFRVGNVERRILPSSRHGMSPVFQMYPIPFDTKLGPDWEIQDPIRVVGLGGWGEPSSEALNCRVVSVYKHGPEQPPVLCGYILQF